MYDVKLCFLDFVFGAILTIGFYKTPNLVNLVVVKSYIYHKDLK